MRYVQVLALLLLLLGACGKQSRSAQTTTASSTRPSSSLPFLIPPRYDAALSFSSGVAAAADRQTIGYIDRTGNWLPAISSPRPAGDSASDADLSDLEKMILLNPGAIFPGAEPLKVGDVNIGALVVKASGSGSSITLRSFNGNLSPHEINGMYGFRDKTGKYVVKLEYNNARGFSEDLAAVQVGSEWGYINTAGELVIKPQFIEAGDFHGGVAIVRPAFQTYGYIDRAGKMFIPAKYRKANYFSEGRALVLGDTGFGFIDSSGNEVIAPQYYFADDFSEGLAVFCPGECDEHSGKKGYINTDNDYAINPLFDEARRFGSGLAPVKQNGKWGYIRHDGTFAIKPQFDDAQPFRGNLAIVTIQGGKTFITTTGARPLDAAFSELEPYREGAALACRDNKCGFLRELGSK